MNTDFINLTSEQWLTERLKEGYVFRKLNAKAYLCSQFRLITNQLQFFEFFFRKREETK
jgi:hypothetical protein